MKISDFNRKQVGKAVQLQDVRFSTKTDCIIVKVEANEILIMYYEKEIKEIIYKAISEEDLIFNDYKFKLLS
ncbi:hypothetical protein CDFC105_73153 [Clostridioides difficile]|nr:hypothetical protein CDFC105_60662 [Clostridioides difficile]CZR95946.1 hypothetical protein CDFC105_60735 [Clostridioides difficile]CZS09297.1 hypothetical protein CDFC105_73080 [Clostridioides difficile]CZS09496.1 hypothetical protein CDFC105_73153 [Clostridioides difficile]